MAMPRPTVAQLAYGSCTVIFSTFVMLLLSGASSVVGVAVVAGAARRGGAARGPGAGPAGPVGTGLRRPSGP
jgi:hypothetical protein